MALQWLARHQALFEGIGAAAWHRKTPGPDGDGEAVKVDLGT